MRDVAGMIRSFNYAGRSALQRIPPTDARIEELREAIEQWERRTVTAFLDAYRTAAGTCSSIPQDDVAFDDLLDLFTLEKALYEICYEAANRPEWLSIPLHGVERILEPEQA